MAYVGRKIRIGKLSQKTRDTCIQGRVAYDSRHGAGQGDGGGGGQAGEQAGAWHTSRPA